MKVVYLPLYRMAISYTVSFGRRWSVLEHILLIELARGRKSLSELAAGCGLPERLIVEALINLLRASWIEVRSSGGVGFQATAVGARRAAESTLPPQVQTAVRWISLCVDRLTGAWLRADDLDLVYESDLPEGADVIKPQLQTYDPLDGRIRELFYLALDEALEPVEPQFRNPSRPYARVVVAFDRIESGLPSEVPSALTAAIIEAASPGLAPISADMNVTTTKEGPLCYDQLEVDDVLVGGGEHRRLLADVMAEARSHVVLHSCFLDPGTIKALIPDLEKAASRGVRVDLLWGLHHDPESASAARATVADCVAVLGSMSSAGRKLVQLSPQSSGSHAKVLIYDRPSDGKWITVVGSCNYLSSLFDSLDISIRTRSQRLARYMMSQLIASQLPSSGSWSPVARRLNSTWDYMRRAGVGTEGGAHLLSPLVDKDHYACIRRARDYSTSDIVVGCDIYGLAAETSVVVPMERAAELGRKVRLIYRRPSRLLRETGRLPDNDALKKRGITLETASSLHGKFVVWDNDHLAVTSFNWLSSTVDGARVKGAELGVMARGPNVRAYLREKVLAHSDGALSI